MKISRRLPAYGFTDFEEMRKDDCAYVDKTRFIEKLESLRLYYPFIIRPRRFGKTLFTKVLEAYYDKAAKSSFDQNFKGTYIYEHLTSTESSFCVLHLDFSGLESNCFQEAFFQELNHSFQNFFRRYQRQGIETLLAKRHDDSPAEYFKEFLRLAGQDSDLQLYVIIDEYDQFANELLSSPHEKLKTTLENNCLLKDFYTELKVATNDGPVKRIFITGVTDILLDSISSIFPYRQDISHESEFAEMLGFTEEELKWLIATTLDVEAIGKPTEEIVSRMRTLYGGYQFSPKADRSLFNPASCIRYLNSLRRTATEPTTLADRNVVVFSKLERLLSLANPLCVKEIVEEIVNTEKIGCADFGGKLTLNTANSFTSDNLLAALYFTGFLTLAPEESRFLVCPNQCALIQFFKYFVQEIEELPISLSDNNLIEATIALQNGDIRSFLNLVYEENSKGFIRTEALRPTEAIRKYLS